MWVRETEVVARQLPAPLSVVVAGYRWCLRMTKTKRNRKPTVGTIKKSIAPTPAAWLCRKVFQVCDRPRPLLAMYLATDPDEEQSVCHCQPWLRGYALAQHIQLMPQKHDLSF